MPDHKGSKASKADHACWVCVIVSSGVLAVGRASMSKSKANRNINFGSAVFYLLNGGFMENNYTEGGYVRNSDEPFVSAPIVHHSNSPPITLKDLNRKRIDISNPISDVIWRIIMDHIEASKNLKLLKENRIRLLNYNHLFSSNAFKDNCVEQLKNINKQITNIENSFLSASHRSVFTVRVEWSRPK